MFMTGVCNDLFHHAVYASPIENQGGHEGKISQKGVGKLVGNGSNGRVSLVFKRALDRGGGKKGHSLAGEGRRSRRKNS